MENEITTTPINEPENNLIITTDCKNSLISASKWASFLAVLGFIGIGLMFIGAIFILAMSPFFTRTLNFGTGFDLPFVAIGVLYMAMAALYFFPTYYLYCFADKTKQAINTNNQIKLDDSLKNLKRMFKFIGIMIIVIISAYIILIPTFVIIGITSGLPN